MSEPKRYDRREIYDVTYQAAGDECLPEPSENGEFVRWEDYARLKAEVERLRNLGIKLDGYVDLVRHENKRLRKAGDNLARASDENGCHDNGDADDLNDAIKRWNAAKEGKQS